MRPLNISLSLFIATLLLTVTTFAFEKEMAVRSGMIQGTYNNKLNKGKFSATSVFEAEFQMVVDSKSAWSFRGTLALDPGSSRSRYLYAGAGQRYFFGSAAVPIESNYGGDFITIQPKHQFYAGWDSGVGQVLIVEFGDLLGTYATCFEAGAVGGYKYRINRNFSVEISGGYNIGFSIITIPVSTVVTRGLLGFTYLF